MNALLPFFRQGIAAVCVMCWLSAAYAKDEAGLDSLQQLVTQWQQGIASGDLAMLLPLYVSADQAKVVQALPFVKTGQTTLPFDAEMVDGRWLMRGHDIQVPDVPLPIQFAEVLTPEPRTVAQPVVIDNQPTIALPATPSVVLVQAKGNAVSDQPAPLVVQQQTYSVGLSDQNFRKVLTRWANASGWMFEPEHWSVPRDIPVGGMDSVMADFKTAVRRLLKSTLLTDLPVQPCFYSNKVLRVIPASELCSRSEH
jgi:hypothetical protein